MPVSWGHAVEEIARELRAVEDKKKGTVFYSSGRLSNEASYLYQLFARLYGNNNLPDSSNMCHETTSVALPVSIGQPVGTVNLADFAKTDCILFFGQNPGSNSPRMLHPLQAASRRGVPIITYNPLRERGLERFTNPQSPAEMLTRQETRVSSQYHQVKAGGDLAALAGICKGVLALHDDAKAAGGSGVVDEIFIAQHTQGFETFTDWLRAQDWDELERRSGLHRADLESTAKVYSQAKAAIGVYGMGLTQHAAGVETVQMLVNLLLLRGNIGREGSGICPVRGHSNVQGQRTVGITEKPELFPMDRLGRSVRLRAPARDRLQHGRGLRGRSSRARSRLLHAGRQFRPRHPGSRPDGAGLAQDPPDRQRHHQAQPQRASAGRDQLHPAGDRPRGDRRDASPDHRLSRWRTHRPAFTAAAACARRPHRI